MSGDGGSNKGDDDGQRRLGQQLDVGDREALLSEAEAIAGTGSYLWEPGSPPLWSDGFYRILGYEPGSVEPSMEAFFARVHPDDAERLAEAHAAAHEGAVPDEEWRILRADTGELRYLRGTAHVNRNATEGQPLRMVGALMDVTQAKLSALRDERALVTMRVAERLAKMGSFVVDLDPMQTEWSEGLYEMAGLDDRDADLEARAAMIHSEDREAHTAWFGTVMQGAPAPPIQSRFVRPGGEVRHALTHAALVQFESDGRERVVGTSMDVTERVMLEERLRHAAKMEAVGTLAAGVAHDFNNYLMVINSYLDILGRSRSSDAHSLAELRGHAKHATKRCMELTQQLLTFARRRPASREVVDLGEAVERIGALLQSSVGRNVTLSLACPSATVAARVDPAHLEQILANLAINGRDAILASGRRGGAIELKVDALVLSTPQRLVPVEVGAGRWARIRVLDDGSGIAAEDLGRIFDPYFTTKGAGQGTGLGLAAVYGAVVQNEGHVTVETRQGNGSCFTVWLPEVDSPAVETVKPAEGPRAGAGTHRVLVVDDIPSVRSVAALTLRAAGFEVTEASDGADALAQLERGTFDLVLSDVRMPRMDGQQLAAMLRERWPDLPVVLMTGFSDAITDGDLPVLHKPISSEDLVEAVRMYVGKRQLV